MKNEFTSEKELKDKFHVYGNYYSLNYDNISYKCRNVSDILNKTIKLPNSTDLSKKEPDSIFIMLNPGKSAPVSGNYKEKRIIDLEIIEFEETLIDSTQYQLMRLMILANWNHVRIINLSDLIAPDPKIFWESFKRFKDMDHVHSVFHEKRKDELKKMVSTNNIFAAWTVDPPNELIELCKKSFDLSTIKGYKKNNDYLFYHPLPKNRQKQIEWLMKMQEIL